MLLQNQKLKPVLYLFLSALSLSSFHPIHNGKNPISSSGQGFAVVELFTSEGCSSCPPADEAVGKLGGWKKNVYVLSFHVDYWNQLGWIDKYSDPAYSIRQQEYGILLHLNNIYTPQIVVNGKVQFVGSNETQLKETIEESIAEIPELEIHLKVLQETYHRIPVKLISDGKAGLKLNLALVQNSAKDFVQRGENKGKTLSHFFVVRNFKVLPDQKGSNTFYLDIPQGLRSSDCTVIAFLQNSASGHIIAATGSSIP
jgi:hypothetical protein